MLFNKPNTNHFDSAILYVGPICKANTRKGKVLLSNFYVAHDDVGPKLVLRYAPKANDQPTVHGFCQRWPKVVRHSCDSKKSTSTCNLHWLQSLIR